MGLYSFDVRCLRYCKSTIFQANHNRNANRFEQISLFAILQKYDFSSKSQRMVKLPPLLWVVCDTAKVRFFKQITTCVNAIIYNLPLFAILQKYDFSSKSQLLPQPYPFQIVVCDTAKVWFFKQITTALSHGFNNCWLFAILQKYDFSSKSQLKRYHLEYLERCLRYCKSTIFQANHNGRLRVYPLPHVVCDTAKVRFFKQITTTQALTISVSRLFAILQKYDFSSKSQLLPQPYPFQIVVCDTAKVWFFKQITTALSHGFNNCWLFAILQKYDFSSKSQLKRYHLEYLERCLRYCKSTIFQANHNGRLRVYPLPHVVCDTAKVRFFKQITTTQALTISVSRLFAILQKYDFSSKSQPRKR